MSDLSKQELIRFLTWAEDKGLMKSATARSLKSACNSVLAVMDEDEGLDLSKTDMEGVFQRYENKNSYDVNPRTLASYRSRVKYAVDEFIKYNGNKAGWKPSGGQRSPSQAARKKASRHESLIQEDPIEAQILHGGEWDAADITYQFPIRRNLVVTVKGIPFDVKKAEMSRFTAFLSNLVAESDAEVQNQPRLNPPPAIEAEN